MCCGELAPINGHGAQWGSLLTLGEDGLGLRGCAHHVKGDLHAQQLGLELLEDGDRRR